MQDRGKTPRLCVGGLSQRVNFLRVHAHLDKIEATSHTFIFPGMSDVYEGLLV